MRSRDRVAATSRPDPKLRSGLTWPRTLCQAARQVARHVARQAARQAARQTGQPDSLTMRWMWRDVTRATVLAIAGVGAVTLATWWGSVGTPAAAAAAALLTGYVIATVQWRTRARTGIADALQDPLTGLPTRSVIEKRLDAATRCGEPVTVALADVDGLHALNGAFGHAAGDLYLTAVAHRLARAVPAGGVLVRQSGDEFTLVVPGTDADTVAAAIGAVMAGPALIAGQRVQPRASIGIATSAGTHADADARHARARADVAMYAAKAAGGNHIQIWNPVRHGEPAPDGTRPLRRRRDTDPQASAAAGPCPAAGSDTIRLLLPRRDAVLVYQALVRARDGEAVPPAQRPRSGPDAPDSTDHRTDHSARVGADPHVGGYADLVTRLGSLLDPGRRGLDHIDPFPAPDPDG